MPKNKERVIRVLMNKPDGSLSKYKLAKLAKTSFSWTHDILKELEKRKLIKKTKVLDYKKLFNYWIKIHKKPKARIYSIQDPIKLLKKVKLDYVLTNYMAENLVQHHLFPSRVDTYVKEKELKKWHTLLCKEGLYGGGNFRVFIEDEHVFYNKQTIKSLKVVSIPQLILDLFVEGGVCVEAAEMLLKGYKNVRSF